MIRLPAEWEKQEMILIAFPHSKTDWADDLQSAYSIFVKIASAICFNQKLIILVPKDDREKVKSMFCYHDRISFVSYETDDTWIRDFGPISIYDDGERKLLDFKFNAWGDKYSSSLDDIITKQLHSKWYFGLSELISEDFVLEGGSIDSNGAGIVLTTTNCLLNQNRNKNYTKEDIERKLKDTLGAKQILWLDNCILEGDDTDGHIDMFARFVDSDTIVYVDINDLKQQLEKFKTLERASYNLIPLPIPSPKYKNGKKLPASYANFLICNDVVLLPTYDDKHDREMIDLFKRLFPDREIIPINALRLIEEGGSIHCSTMNVAF
jgi:agmatine deiminase